MTSSFLAEDGRSKSCRDQVLQPIEDHDQGWKTQAILILKVSHGKLPTHQKPLVQSSLNEYLNAFKTFLNWAVRLNVIPSNPLSEVVKAKTKGKEKRLRRALTQDELCASLNTAPEERALYPSSCLHRN